MVRFEYSHDETPPALMAPVVVGSLESERRKEILGKIDTGAGISGIPHNLRRELRLTARNTVEVKGAVGKGVARCTTYFVSFTVEGLVSMELEVILLRDRDYLLIGRDFLNQIVLHADGPAEEFELSV